MRVWFLKETKSFCTSCATGCNTTHRHARRCDLSPDTARKRCRQLLLDVRLRPAQFRLPRSRSNGCSSRSMFRGRQARAEPIGKLLFAHAAMQLRQFAGWQIAILASGRMTNEELWLTSRLAQTSRRRTDRYRAAHRTGRRHSAERRSQSEYQRREVDSWPNE